MATTKCKYHPYIDAYITGIQNEDIIVGNDIKKAIPYIEKKLDHPDVIIRGDMIDKAVELIEKYFQIKLFDWELFIIALIHCYYKSNDTVVFDEFLIVMGRGNGKNGFISPVAWYLTTHYHGITGYNIDIIANGEDQAETSFDDVYNVLEEWESKLKKFFYWTKEKIVNLKTKSYIKYNTSNARTKDGKRTACIILDELHEYENYDLINVFFSSFGKKKHARIFKISTMGHVREGVLDEEMRIADDVLNGIITDIGLCPLIYRIDNEKEALEPKKWHKSNPSLKYLDTLMIEMQKAFKLLKYKQSVEKDFYTKRMNWPKGNSDLQVTEWDNIVATNKDIPDLRGWSCVVGIDLTKTTDFASVNFHFKNGDLRYDINHSWLCLESKDLSRIKPPWQQWADNGLLTLVDDVEIHPRLVVDYIQEKASLYNIKKIALDNYRYALVSSELTRIGFDIKKRKNVKLVRPSDIMQIVPVIESCFVNKFFTWGDNPVLRWATNNTKLIAAGKKKGTDTGNFYYGKIESKSRKTDPFMALVASMTLDSELKSAPLKTPDHGVFKY
jgi:phage terminase large subunit-like protein